MASTRLQRKERKNRVVAKKKVDTIQRLNKKPVIKNIDVDKIKEEFKKGNINRPVDFDEPSEANTANKAVAKEKNKSEAKKEAKPAKTEAKKTEKVEAKKEEAPAGVDVDALLKSVGKADESNKDDLKKITGIGPAFEKKLNEIGLYTYEQISNLKKNDIDNLSNMEGVSADKIESDNWIGDAKNLLEANKGE